MKHIKVHSEEHKAQQHQKQQNAYFNRQQHQKHKTYILLNSICVIRNSGGARQLDKTPVIH